MKQILIIISILLLSSPLFGQETGVLFLHETSSGLVWKIYGDEGINPKYKGEIKNREPNGRGIKIYPNGYKMEGRFKDGYLNGQGKVTKPDGRKYIAELKNGSPNGIGTEYFPGLGKYNGEWEKGLPNGKGEFIYTNGGNYIGGWKDGKWNGQGKFTAPDGRMFIGESRNNVKWNGIWYDKYGNIIGKKVNGVPNY